MGDKKLVGIYLTMETLKRLKIFAAEKLTSVSEIAERAVNEFLDRNRRDD